MSYRIVQRKNGKIAGTKGPYKSKASAAAAAQRLADQLGQSLQVEKNPTKKRKVAKRKARKALRANSSDVAATIGQQMGGLGRLKVMLGAKHFLDLGNGLSFQWPNKERSRGNALRVILKGDDTYRMEFLSASGSKPPKVVKVFDGIYADQLIPLFEQQTGWYLTMGRMRNGRAVGSWIKASSSPSIRWHEKVLPGGHRLDVVGQKDDNGHWYYTAKRDKQTVGHYPSLAAAKQAAEGLRNNPGTKVQTLIFDRGQFTGTQARDWARKHKFSSTKIDATGPSIRIRQKPPGSFRPDSFRTISLRPGVKAVIGILRVATRKNPGMGLAKKAAQQALVHGTPYAKKLAAQALRAGADRLTKNRRR